MDFCFSGVRFVPLKNCSLIYWRHRCQWNGAQFNLYSWSLSCDDFVACHTDFVTGYPVFKVISKGPVTFTPVAKRCQWHLRDRSSNISYSFIFFTRYIIVFYLKEIFQDNLMKFEGTFLRDVDANLDVHFFAYICWFSCQVILKFGI